MFALIWLIHTFLLVFSECHLDGWESVGCWRDLPFRAIASLEGKSKLLSTKWKNRTNPLATCAEAAAEQKLKVFAIQDGGQCFGGPYAQYFFDQYGPSNLCKNGLGGTWSNDVYSSKTAFERVLKEEKADEKPIQCSKPLDLVFLVDGAGPASLENKLRWGEMLKFVSKATEEFDPDTTRFGVVRYGSTPKLIVNMTDNQDVLHMRDTLMAEQFPGGKRTINDAMKVSWKEMFKRDKRNANKVIVALTTGNIPYGPWGSTLFLTGRNIRLMAFGIDKEPSYRYLESLSSWKRPENIYSLDTEQLLKSVPYVTKDICTGTKKTTIETVKKGKETNNIDGNEFETVGSALERQAERKAVVKTNKTPVENVAGTKTPIQSKEPARGQIESFDSNSNERLGAENEALNSEKINSEDKATITVKSYHNNLKSGSVNHEELPDIDTFMTTGSAMERSGSESDAARESKTEKGGDNEEFQVVGTKSKNSGSSAVKDSEKNNQVMSADKIAEKSDAEFPTKTEFRQPSASASSSVRVKPARKGLPTSNGRTNRLSSFVGTGSAYFPKSEEPSSHYDEEIHEQETTTAKNDNGEQKTYTKAEKQEDYATKEKQMQYSKAEKQSTYEASEKKENYGTIGTQGSSATVDKQTPYSKAEEQVPYLKTQKHTPYEASQKQDDYGMTGKQASFATREEQTPDAEVEQQTPYSAEDEKAQFRQQERKASYATKATQTAYATTAKQPSHADTGKSSSYAKTDTQNAYTNTNKPTVSATEGRKAPYAIRAKQVNYATTPKQTQAAYTTTVKQALNANTGEQENYATTPKQTHAAYTTTVKQALNANTRKQENYATTPKQTQAAAYTIKVKQALNTNTGKKENHATTPKQAAQPTTVKQALYANTDSSDNTEKKAPNARADKQWNYSNTQKQASYKTTSKQSPSAKTETEVSQKLTPLPKAEKEAPLPKAEKEAPNSVTDKQRNYAATPKQPSATAKQTPSQNSVKAGTGISEKQAPDARAEKPVPFAIKEKPSGIVEFNENEQHVDSILSISNKPSKRTSKANDSQVEAANNTQVEAKSKGFSNDKPLSSVTVDSRNETRSKFDKNSSKEKVQASNSRSSNHVKNSTNRDFDKEIFAKIQKERDSFVDDEEQESILSPDTSPIKEDADDEKDEKLTEDAAALAADDPYDPLTADSEYSAQRALEQKKREIDILLRKLDENRRRKRKRKRRKIKISKFFDNDLQSADDSNEIEENDEAAKRELSAINHKDAVNGENGEMFKGQGDAEVSKQNGEEGKDRSPTRRHFHRINQNDSKPLPVQRPMIQTAQAITVVSKLYNATPAANVRLSYDIFDPVYSSKETRNLTKANFDKYLAKVKAKNSQQYVTSGSKSGHEVRDNQQFFLRRSIDHEATSTTNQNAYQIKPDMTKEIDHNSTRQVANSNNKRLTENPNNHDVKYFNKQQQPKQQQQLKGSSSRSPTELASRKNFYSDYKQSPVSEEDPVSRTIHITDKNNDSSGEKLSGFRFSSLSDVDSGSYTIQKVSKNKLLVTLRSKTGELQTFYGTTERPTKTEHKTNIKPKKQPVIKPHARVKPIQMTPIKKGLGNAIKKPENTHKKPQSNTSHEAKKPPKVTNDKKHDSTKSYAKNSKLTAYDLFDNRLANVEKPISYFAKPRNRDRLIITENDDPYSDASMIKFFINSGNEDTVLNSENVGLKRPDAQPRLLHIVEKDLPTTAEQRARVHDRGRPKYGQIMTGKPEVGLKDTADEFGEVPLEGFSSENKNSLSDRRNSDTEVGKVKISHHDDQIGSRREAPDKNKSATGGQGKESGKAAQKLDKAGKESDRAGQKSENVGQESSQAKLELDKAKQKSDQTSQGSDQTKKVSDKGEQKSDDSKMEWDKYVTESYKSDGESGRSGKVLDKAVKDSDKGGQESGKAGKASDTAGKESGREGQETAKTGKGSDKVGQDSGKAGKESDKAGQESSKAGKESDKAGQESGKAGKESDKAVEESGKAAKETDRAEKESDKARKESGKKEEKVEKSSGQERKEESLSSQKNNFHEPDSLVANGTQLENEEQFVRNEDKKNEKVLEPNQRSEQQDEGKTNPDSEGSSSLEGAKSPVTRQQRQSQDVDAHTVLSKLQEKIGCHRPMKVMYVIDVSDGIGTGPARKKRWNHLKRFLRTVNDKITHGGNMGYIVYDSEPRFVSNLEPCDENTEYFVTSNECLCDKHSASYRRGQTACTTHAPTSDESIEDWGAQGPRTAKALQLAREHFNSEEYGNGNAKKLIVLLTHQASTDDVTSAERDLKKDSISLVDIEIGERHNLRKRSANLDEVIPRDHQMEVSFYKLDRAIENIVKKICFDKDTDKVRRSRIFAKKRHRYYPWRQ